MNNKNSSQTLVLEQIKPDSTVLEMGCATGYMTKYMKEKLGCTVDVVDLDCENVRKAEAYAREAMCDDIDDGIWFIRLYQNTNEYDYVLFADVLEHLREPKDALKWAVRLLKPDGKIVISIPNICHNDIIIKLFYDRFTYTCLGLLDNTHIHFWGLQDFANFAEQAGLKITDTRMVKFPTQGTEQRTDFRVDGELMNLLNKRQNGEVYQWVFTCEKR
jgi:methionine biosynthesis protein MetW